MYRPTGYSLISRSSVLNRAYNFTINRFEQVVTGLEALKQGLNVVNAPSQCQVPTKTKKPLYSVQEMNPGNEEWYLVLNRIVKWRDNLLNRISVWRPRRHAATHTPLTCSPLKLSDLRECFIKKNPWLSATSITKGITSRDLYKHIRQ